MGLGRRCLFPQVLLAAGMLAGVSVTEEWLDSFLYIYTSGLWMYLAFKIRVQIYEICDVLSIHCFDIVTPYLKELPEAGDDNMVSNMPAVTAPQIWGGADDAIKKTN